METKTYTCDRCKAPVSKGLIKGRYAPLIAGCQNQPYLIYIDREDERPDLCRNCMLEEFKRYFNLVEGSES